MLNTCKITQWRNIACKSDKQLSGDYIIPPKNHIQYYEKMNYCICEAWHIKISRKSTEKKNVLN